MNWLDILLGAILLLSMLSGFRKGFARTGIGIGATIIGILCGLWFYRTIGAFLNNYIASRTAANVIGFLIVFAAVISLGSLIAWLIEKLLKVVQLSWLNRLLGGVLGLVQGALAGAMIILLMMAFSTKEPHSVANSRLAPYVIGSAKVIASAAPHEVREGFDRSYRKVHEMWAEALRKSGRRPPTDEM